MEDNNLNNEEVSNGNNNNKSKKILVGIIVNIVLFLLAITIYVIVDKKDNDNIDDGTNIKEENSDNNNDNVEQENNNQKLEDEKEELTDNDKIAINKKLGESRLSGGLFEIILASYSIYDLNEVTKLNNLFESDMSKFVFTKSLMDKDKLTEWYSDDPNGNGNMNIYSKCALGTGSISIKDNIFNQYYKKLFGEDFDKSKIDNTLFVDGYICTSMPTGYTATRIPVLKAVSKTYDDTSGTYEIDMVSLGDLTESYQYNEPEILEWPSEKEKFKLTLKYMINDDNSYQIISFIVNGEEQEDVSANQNNNIVENMIEEKILKK